MWTVTRHRRTFWVDSTIAGPSVTGACHGPGVFAAPPAHLISDHDAGTMIVVVFYQYHGTMSMVVKHKSLGLPLAIGPAIRRLRDAAGLPQQQAAAAAGLTYSAWTKLEQGDILDPRWSTVRAVCRALGVTLQQLAAADDAS